ncbi:MAG TPA: hypothetical protein VMZ25_10485 [Terriglobales bacterium]|nr:hypothetical protein [Terriglobales bacterium]
MRRSLGIAVVIGCCLAAAAKDRALIGVILFTGDAGPAYAQVQGVQLNGKGEVYVCSVGAPITSDNYKKQPKMSLALATALERGADGVLTMTTQAGANCIVPQNLKLEKNKSYTASDLAEMAQVMGALVSGSTNAGAGYPPQIKRGTKIVFVASPDVENAEYLRADRAQTVPLWQEYVKQYPSGPHVAQARSGLAALYTKQAEAELAAYQKSLAANQPEYARLNQARLQIEESRRALSTFARADVVQAQINEQVQTLVGFGNAEIEQYKRALAERTAGYEHLKAARTHLEHARAADPTGAAVGKAEAELNAQTQKVERAVAQAEGLVAAQRFDEAHAAIAAYTAFAAELPRVQAVIEAAFKSHRTKGDALLSEGKMAEAIAEFKRALEYRQDASLAEVLKKTEADLNLANNKEAAAKAAEEAKALAAQKKFVEAYETLSNLPDAQRTFVTMDLEALQKDYVKDLIGRSDSLTKLHLPIRGRADEDAARQAFAYLTKATSLEADEGTRIKLDLVSDAVSDYYQKQAQRLLDKPRGSGLGLGWLLVKEGQRYKPDLEGLKDQVSKYAPDYDTKGKLSVAIYFRDQTSRRDSLGFADQLADTVASGLETSGLTGVKTLTRKDRNAMEADVSTGAMLSNLQLVGDIIRHQVDKKQDVQRLTSRYRAGHREVKSPEWIEMAGKIAAAERDYERDRATFNAGIAKMNKRLQEATARELDAKNAAIEQLKQKLIAIPETQLQTITETYTYTKRTINYVSAVEVALRLVDPAVEDSKMTDSIKVEIPKSVTILENVKSEDVDGIVADGEPLDEIQLMAEAESQAKATMVKKLIEWVRDAPPKILKEARARAANNDMEAAAERYIVYLNSTAMKATPERQEAQIFLRSNFNVTTVKIEN